ncbi:Uncharacterised protein [Mycobacterium tuberculosis]|uniref:Uncharacterized protein n=1 Tax=Mycobacterium tuberculosis TaxID=1773 RepID=A0A655IU56_MYCTX|nr:Uncharacterised protein [Mycobacterium tuberculosis]CKT90811.1 Uncharacterised protein [Mycobacterium tuberculosis]CNM99892.1 Uncharacterised protein [Mycobacterium tuberculosis]COW06337.1 Uncharacterised protein [Mycobacterium tuberculosis]COW15526.1 Uncharacterised protein [Mycobacterium tuberculosis]
MYSRRTSVYPSPSNWMCSASNACKWASTPSLTSPGSTPSSWLLSCSIPSIVMRSCSPALFSTTHTGAWPPDSSVNQHGGLIQFNGL